MVRTFALLVAALATTPAMAGNELIKSGKKVSVAKSDLSVRPNSEWNKLEERPGKNAESWTLDGDALNDVTFYGGIANGKTLFKTDQANGPLPRVSATMLIIDIPVLLERSYRIALGTTLMTIDTVEPVEFVGSKGVFFTYSFVKRDGDVRRRGEARAAMIGGKLYMITYEAPALHYFAHSLSAYRQLADSAGF